MTPHEQRRDALAKILAASMMGLIKDPSGTTLPEGCYGQLRDKAEATLYIITSGQTPFGKANHKGR